ncbi:MAG: hypothetical protein ACREJQ_05150, partial [bacterium]
ALEHLVADNPFKGIMVTPLTRFYVTFLCEKPKGALRIPYVSPDRCFQILRATESEVCSVLTHSPDCGSTDFMKFLEEEFGRKITTRNWNTIIKVLQVNGSPPPEVR